MTASNKAVRAWTRIRDVWAQTKGRISGNHRAGYWTYRRVLRRVGGPVDRALILTFKKINS